MTFGSTRKYKLFPNILPFMSKQGEASEFYDHCSSNSI